MPLRGEAASAGGARRHQRRPLRRVLRRCRRQIHHEDLGIYRVVFSHLARADVAGFMRSILGPVLEHDVATRGVLTGTLATYLDSGRHHARTAAALHVHPNTLYKRLDRVDQLLGEAWRDPARGLEVHLALRLRQLAAAVSPHTAS